MLIFGATFLLLFATFRNKKVASSKVYFFTNYNITNYMLLIWCANIIPPIIFYFCLKPNCYFLKSCPKNVHFGHFYFHYHLW